MEPSPNPAALLPLSTQCLLVGDATRVALLRELAKGEPLPVTEIARRLGRMPTAIAKHLALLRKTGVTVQGFGRLYRLAPAFAPQPGATVIDFGQIALKLDTPG